MTDPQTTSPLFTAPADASPEELEAAMAGHMADEMQRLQTELAELKAKNADLADQFLRAKADTENMRRRSEEEVGQGTQIRH